MSCSSSSGSEEDEGVHAYRKGGLPCGEAGRSLRWREVHRAKKARLGKLLHRMARLRYKMGGSRSKDYFDRHGDLKRIRRLRFWPIDRLLVDKYKFSESDAREFSDFLGPLHDFTPEKRPTAEQCLQHPWLNNNSGQSTKVETKEAGLDKLEVGMVKPQLKLGR